MYKDIYNIYWFQISLNLIIPKKYKNREEKEKQV